jgi:Rps23 Pro-64 3,4-dihydroxylase Tpa1-like proline 4-hydroxylase
MIVTSPATGSDATIDKLLKKSSIERLVRLAAARAAQYRSATPFSHTVIDDFLPSEVLEEAVRDFPSPYQLKWLEYDNTEERKLAFPVVERLPTSLRDVLYFLNAPPMLEFLEHLTGINALLPDPYFVGGGLHQIQSGGFLGVHADFNKYERFGLDRRINLLLYLNKHWQDEFGGHLELWNRSMSECSKKVLPIFNRCVIFSTTDYAFHGHPAPLTCPKGWTRKSIATYYYTNGRPEEELGQGHSTLFQTSPVDTARARPRRFKTLKRITHALLPPILFDALHYLRSPRK